MIKNAKNANLRINIKPIYFRKNEGIRQDQKLGR